MKLPNSIRIGPIDYKLEECDIADFGEIDSKLSRIRIKKEIEEQQQVLTLLHEATHAVLTEFGFQESDNEQLVSTISAGLFSLLKDNPFLIGYFK